MLPALYVLHNYIYDKLKAQFWLKSITEFFFIFYFCFLLHFQNGIHTIIEILYKEDISSKGRNFIGISINLHGRIHLLL